MGKHRTIPLMVQQLSVYAHICTLVHRLTDLRHHPFHRFYVQRINIYDVCCSIRLPLKNPRLLHLRDETLQKLQFIS